MINYTFIMISPGPGWHYNITFFDLFHLPGKFPQPNIIMKLTELLDYISKESN